jgi:F-type H+-transporting ATPase subunit a
MSNIPPIKLTPDDLFQVGPVMFNHSLISAFLITAILIVMTLIVRRKAGIVPSRSQMAVEIILEYFLDLLRGLHGSEKRARVFLPLVLTLFFVLIVSNQLSLFPIVDSVYLYEGDTKTKFFDAPTSHYSMTIALAIFSLGFAHIVSMMWRPFKHIGNYIKIGPLLKARTPMQFMMACIDMFLGFMDIIGEFSKIISPATRLFGNMFAGEVIITIISGLFVFTQFFFPIPFLALSIFSGFVQAFVFTMLMTLFTSGTINNLELEEKQNT